MKFKVGQYIKIYNSVAKIEKMDGVRVFYKLLDGSSYTYGNWFHYNSMLANNDIEIITKDEAIMELL